MNKIKILVLSLLIMLIPGISLAETGHINGCTNTSFDTNCCTKTFRITPRAGYRVVDVIVNGVSQGPITSYTFSNITGPQTLKVIAELIDGSGSGTGGGTASGDGVHKVQFNANGGYGTMTSQIFAEGTTQSLKANTYTRQYYNFLGWSLTPDGSVLYADQYPYYSATEDRVLYAIWDPIVYSITYNLNGGSVSTSNPTTYTTESNTITLNNPSKSGYVFLGWTGSNGETPQITITIPKGSGGNLSYIANWQFNSVYITADGGMVYTSSNTQINSSSGPVSIVRGDYIELRGMNYISVYENNVQKVNKSESNYKYYPTTDITITSTKSGSMLQGSEHIQYYITTN